MRKGIADLHRAAELSQASNDRYLDALAAVDPEDATRLEDVLRPITRRTTWKGRPARALHPLNPDDAHLFKTVTDARYLATGFRNRDLREHLYPSKRPSPAKRRRDSARVTRQIRLLRAHGLVRKVPGTHRYLLTTKGRRIGTAVLAARQAPYARLVQGLAA